MKIAYFTDTYTPEINGLTNTMAKLGGYLDARHINQLVFAPQYDSDNSGSFSEYRKIYRYKGITTTLSTESRLAFPSFWEIDGICDSFCPDIVHVTTELGIGFRGMRYALSRRIPLVMSFHTDYFKYLKYHNLGLIQSLLEKYLAWFYSYPARILVPSRFTFGELSCKGYRNLDIWSRGIDTVCFNPSYRNEELRNQLGKNKFIFLYVGRLSREKNLDLLLHAALEMERLFPNQTLFVLTGNGSYMEVIKNRYLPNLICTGFRNGKELSEIYASADCFAFPSGTETFGNSVLEAMASGLPVAGVASGGVLDFLSHNYNALLCSADNAAAFTNNLVSLMKNKKLRIHLANNALKTALSRDWNQIFDDLINVYAAVIEETWQRTFKKPA